MADAARDLLDEMGIDVKFVAEYPLAKIKVADEDSQVRSASHIAPSKTVRQYFHQMEGGAEFPPVVICKRTNEIADGNTRVAAAREAGRETFPAYVADFATLTIRKFFAGRINQVGGERLTPSEAKHLALTLLEEGADHEAISLGLGVSVDAVREWGYEQEARNRLDGNLDVVRLKSGHLVRLNGIKSNPVMFEMAKLIVDANLSTGVAGKCITVINKARSEDEAFDMIANLRKEYTQNIRRTKAGVGVKKPSATACIALAYSTLQKRSLSEYEMEINGEVTEKTLAEITWISEFSEKLMDTLTKGRS